MIKANKDKVEISGSPEQVSAELIAITNEFVMWIILNSDRSASEVEKAAIELYEAWKNREES